MLVGNASLPAKTLPELVAYVKANPGKVNFASYTAGTLSHVMGLQLNKAAGIDMTHVGYKGSTPALQDLMGGHVQLMFDGMATSIPLIKGGKIKAFAVSTPKRSPLLPDVPTFTELGYPQLETIAWMGLWVKPDLPAALQAQIREAALKALAQPAVRERLQDIGFEPRAAAHAGGAERVAEGRLRARRRGAEVDRLQAGVGRPGRVRRAVPSQAALLTDRASRGSRAAPGAPAPTTASTDPTRLVLGAVGIARGPRRRVAVARGASLRLGGLDAAARGAPPGGSRRRR